MFTWPSSMKSNPNKKYELAGQLLTLSELAFVGGVSSSAMLHRLLRGLSPDQAIKKPLQEKKVVSVGKRFGRLVVIAEGPVLKPHGRRWICQCDCGNSGFVVRQMCLRNGSTKSCGCATKERARSRIIANSQDWSGTTKSNGTTIVKSLDIVKRQRRWQCVCACGVEFIATRERVSKHRWLLWCSRTCPARLSHQSRAKNTIVFNNGTQP